MPPMSKVGAMIALMRMARSDRLHTAEAKRAVRACGVLGLSADDTRAIMQWLEYCKDDGSPTCGNVKRVWP
jgi:hypothetical protein